MGNNVMNFMETGRTLCSYKDILAYLTNNGFVITSKHSSSVANSIYAKIDEIDDEIDRFTDMLDNFDEDQYVPAFYFNDKGIFCECDKLRKFILSAYNDNELSFTLYKE